MSAIGGTIIAGSTLWKLIAGALVAGLGVTLAFSLLIYCADRAIQSRRADHRAAAVLFQLASFVSLAMVLGLVVYGLILTTSKPK